MIHSIRVKNYQSHLDTQIELKPLTVIVGPSSAGKSALIRALKALSYNQSGKDFITHGQVTTTIEAVTDKGTLTLVKGKPEDSYTITIPGKDPEKWTKMGVGVPEDVTKFLGIPSKNALNFAGQFDMPYLLKTSAAEVARVLGELTNVSAIFEASREALRRKGTFSSTLKTRQADLEGLLPKQAQFEKLPERIAALEAAETAYKVADRASTKLDELNDLLLTLKTATARLKTAHSSVSAPLPDLAPTLELYKRSQRLQEIVRSLQEASSSVKSHTKSKEEAAEEMTQLDAEYETLLREAGTCPLCHQDTTGVHTHALVTV